MLRKVLFQAHWCVGITLGAVLAMSGATGGLMAFDQELGNLLLGYYGGVAPQSGRMLSAAELYRRVHEANPDRVIVVLTPAADARHAARVEFASDKAVIGGGSRLGDAETRNNKHLIDPYTGVLMPESGFSRRYQTFITWLREIHQGHWIPGTTIGRVIYNSVGIGAIFLFGMALTGLYMRWPRGSAGRWRSWFKINTRLKGRAFLWNLHSVLGTLVLLAYLVSAHSGAFQNGTVSWYGRGVRALIGVPPATGPEGPAPGRQVRTAPRPPDDTGLWTAFLREVPQFSSAKMLVTRAPTQVAKFTYMPLDDESGRAGEVTIDTVASTAHHIRPSEVVPLTFAETMVIRNQDIHEGRIFGKPGVAVMMLAALAMPVFYVTGWMMYLHRRKRRAANQPE